MSLVRSFKVFGLSLVAIVATLLPAMAVAAQPRSPFAVAAVFPLWWSAEQVQSAADRAGIVSRKGRWNIVVVYGGADVGRRLTRNGAWAILDPSLADCTTSGSEQ
jgi:hypothetical protein